MAPGVIQLSLQAVPEALHRGNLQTVVMAAGAGGQLRHRREPWVGGLRVRIRSEATVARGLIAVHLREIRLIQSACPNVLRFQASVAAELLLDAEAPLHEVRRVEFAARHGGDRHRRKARRRIFEWRRARKLAACESGRERLIRRRQCIDGAVRHARRDRDAAKQRIASRRARFAHRAQQARLKRFHVRRIHSNQIGHAAGKNIAENSEASAQPRFSASLPTRSRCAAERWPGAWRRKGSQVRCGWFGRAADSHRARWKQTSR